MCCLVCGKKKLEERLKGDRIYDLYQEYVSEPDEKFMVPCLKLGKGTIYKSHEQSKYTNSQMFLRLDLGKGKVSWTGDFKTDFKYYLWFNHPVLGIFRASHLHPYSRRERCVVLINLICLNFFITYVVTEAETADDLKAVIYPFQSIILVVLERMLICLLKCRKIQKSCCNCCVCFIECLGHLITLLVSLFILLLLYSVYIAEQKEADQYVDFTLDFLITSALAWFVLDVLEPYIEFRSKHRREKWVHRAPGQDKFKLGLMDVKMKIKPSDKGCCFWIQVVTLFWPWFISSDNEDWHLSESEKSSVGRRPAFKAKEDDSPESENSAEDDGSPIDEIVEMLEGPSCVEDEEDPSCVEVWSCD